MSDYIPEEGIILQILHKLPIKSLVRFTCVSKSWLSLIKNPSFISNHLKHSNKNTLSLLCYCSDQNDVDYGPRKNTEHYSLYSDKQRYSHYMHLYFPFKTVLYKYNPCFRIVGTVNGLICIVDDMDYKTHNIIIWNPLIKKSVTLPEPLSKCYNRVSYGFGFDSHSNDYKVLRLYDEEPDEVALEAEIYSLNMNSWKRVCVPDYRIKGQDRYVIVNGVMNVLAFRELGDDEVRNLILGFDMSDEVFNEIALPESLTDWYPYCLKVFVYKESIVVLEADWYNEGDSYGPSGLRVWVMEKYGVVESWRKILSFDGEEERWANVFGNEFNFDEEFGHWPNLFGFRKNGELFLQMPDEEIVLYDDEREEYKSLEVSGFHSFVDYFVESLELLDNANAQSDPPVENDVIGDATGDQSDDAIGATGDDVTGDAIGDPADDDVKYFDYFVKSMELLDNANAESDPPVEHDANGDVTGDAIGDPADDATDANDPPNQSD